MKNCGRRFHLLVTSKDFVQDLVKLIGPKNEPSPVLQEKVLNIIQTWVEAFRSQPELNGVVAVYRELKAKGIEFPQTDSESMAPIHTPQRSAPISSSLSHHSAPSHHQQQQQHPQQQQQQQQTVSPPRATGPINLNSEQLDKLKNDLALVQENMSIFDSMLTEMTPGNEHLDDRVLLQELNSTCRQMQQRVVELIDQVTNEEITIELLRVNDELNNLFVRYDRFIKKHTGDASITATAAAASSTSDATRSTGAGESSLIDLDDEDSKPSVAVGGEQFLSRFSHMKVTGDNVHKFKTPTGTIADSTSVSGHTADDFDQFAQSRSSTAAGASAAPAVSTTSTKIPRELGESLLLDREEDLEEMAKWLKENDPTSKFDSNSPATRSSGNDTVDNGNDFERFLIERAAAADRVNTGDLQTKPSSAKSDPFGL